MVSEDQQWEDSCMRPLMISRVGEMTVGGSPVPRASVSAGLGLLLALIVI